MLSVHGRLDTEPVIVSTNQITTNAIAQQVTAYYFHGAVRCETCLKIEQQARGLMEQQFSAELAANRLMFTPVNYELPEDAHFLTDYKLPCPSLVLVRRKAGRDRQWKLLSDTWQLVEDPVKFNGYVETEVRNFLDGQERDSTPNQFKLPPAQGDR